MMIGTHVDEGCGEGDTLIGILVTFPASSDIVSVALPNATGVTVKSVPVAGPEPGFTVAFDVASIDALIVVAPTSEAVKVLLPPPTTSWMLAGNP
jgi:hypothetical protein